VRIENNVWITRNGNKDLFKEIPITVEDIEAIMKSTNARPTVSGAAKQSR